MQMPDTFAGGQFNLPLRAAKIVRLAASSEVERPNANDKLKKYNLWVDRVGIVWDADKIPEFAKDNAEATSVQS